MKTKKRSIVSLSHVTTIVLVVMTLFLALCVSFIVKEAYLDATATFFVSAFCFYVMTKIKHEIE